YPILVMLNLLFIIYWGLQIRKRAFYSLVIILAGWGTLHHYLQFTFGHTPDPTKKLIKVMSYNVKVFDLYNWSHNIETRAKIFNLINDESPDIMCLQEFFSRDSSRFNNVDTLAHVLKAKYAHIEYTTHAKLNQHFGIA